MKNKEMTWLEIAFLLIALFGYIITLMLGYGGF